jgi:hypothetical protein
MNGRLYLSLKTAIKLDIASQVTDSPRHVKQIASGVHEDEEIVCEILRTLVSFDIFEETSEKFFSTSKMKEIDNVKGFDVNYAHRFVLLSSINNLFQFSKLNTISDFTNSGQSNPLGRD